VRYRRPRCAAPGSLIPTPRDGKLQRMGLSERDRAMLDFERSWWTEPGRKEDAIRERFGLSAARYRQILSVLIDTDEAEAFDPLVVRRLRRARDERRRARYERRPAGGWRAR
jgi:hypothetical protein